VPTRILVVDDDPRILRTLQVNLRARGYAVTVAADGAYALHAALALRPALVVLDLGLPDMAGLTVIRALRTWLPVPIIVLSGRAGSGDVVAALDTGADDYVTKPFDVDEVVARVRAILRRSVAAPAAGGPVFAVGRAVVDIRDRVVRGGDGELRLTPTEWRLLEILARDVGRVVPGRQLLREVWGPEHEGATHYLRQYVAQLRRKLEEEPSCPRHLLTEPGVGYRLVASAPDDECVPPAGAAHGPAVDDR